MILPRYYGALHLWLFLSANSYKYNGALHLMQSHRVAESLYKSDFTDKSEGAAHRTICSIIINKETQVQRTILYVALYWNIHKVQRTALFVEYNFKEI